MCERVKMRAYVRVRMRVCKGASVYDVLEGYVVGE